MLWPQHLGPVFGNRRIRVRVQRRGKVTPYGGVSLIHDLAMRLEIDKDINRCLPLLKLKRPYYESDHLLTHAYNQYVGGTCIEDIANLQHSAAMKSLFGACRIPAPTTAGDFLRRLSEPHLAAFQRVIDRAREKVWSQLPRSRRKIATVDMDSTVKEVYGECKNGADFSYNGKWSYHPLVFTLAETHEPLRTINRSGNAASADGAADALQEVLPMVKRHFNHVRVRGDSKFYRRENITACEQHGAGFALVMDHYAVLTKRADTLPKRAWRSFYETSDQARTPRKRPSVPRKKRFRYRRKIVRQRGYMNLRTTDQHVAEFDYLLPRRQKDLDNGLAARSYRVVVKRQKIDVSQGQTLLVPEIRYQFVITNIHRSEMTAGEVFHFAHGRGDQENAIEQFKNGMAALRMPPGELLANGAFLMAGQLAWCLRTWLSLLALPKDTVRWEWKTFRHAFVYIAATVARTARQAVVYLADSHRFVEHLVMASQRLQSFAFR